MPVNPAAIAHGPMLIGVTINVLLMGVIVMQMYIYFVTYRRRDQRWLKSLVAFVFLANLLNTGFAVADLYLALINHFGDFQYLTVSTWLFVTDPVIVGTVASSVQMFFAWRVHVLTGKWYLGTLTALLALGQLICAMLMAWKCHEFPAWADFANFTDLIIAWMTTTILVDVTITVILVWYLEAIKPDWKALTNFLTASSGTGMLTSAWALMDLILFLTLPNASHLIFQIPMVKMYTNSLMSSLNSRSRTNQSKIHADAMDGIHSLGKFANSHGLQKDNNTFRLDTNSRPEVFVHVERHELSDLSRERKTATTTTGEHDVKSGWDDPVSNANAV